MKKKLLAFIILHLLLNGMEEDNFKKFKTIVENGIQKCKKIDDKDERFKQWKGIYKYISDQLPNDSHNLNELLKQAINEKYNHPIFHFAVHSKIKKIDTFWDFFPKFIKRLYPYEFNEEIDLESDESISKATNEQFENWVIEAAKQDELLLPYTELACAAWNDKLSLTFDCLKYSVFTNELILLAQRERFTIKPTSTDLHYLSILPKNLTITLGFFRNLNLKTVPQNLTFLEHLKVLNLAKNNLTELPESLSQLKLEILGLAKNNFDELPSVIGSIVSLKTLGADVNRIKKDPCKVIEQLTNLKHLSLSSNQLASFKLKEIPTKLKSLQLDNNLLKEIPPFSESCRLQYIKLGNNPIKEVPYKKLHKLKYLKAYSDPNGKDIYLGKPQQTLKEKIRWENYSVY